VVKYEWDFDDDGRFDAEGQEVKHTFTKDGSHRVLLQVTDNNSAKSTHEEIVEVGKTELVQVVITSQPALEGEAPFEVTLDGSQSAFPRQSITAYKWSFGDGTRDQTGRTVKHTFTSPGSYSVALEITGTDGRKESNVQTITVLAKKVLPQPAINSNIPLQGGVLKGKNPLIVTFKASDKSSNPNIIEYRWSFNSPDTIDEYGDEVTHTFATAGNYTVTLAGVDAENNIGTTTLPVEVEETGLVVKMNATPLSGVVPLDVSFDSSGSFVTSDSEILSYEYDYGDGSAVVRGSAAQTHRYTKSGSFKAKVTVTTNKNEKSSLETVISVLDVPLQSKFDYRPTTGSAPLTVFFNADESTGNIVSYTWNFGDAGVSKLKNPQHVFESSGTYKVSLVVQDDANNVSTFEKEVTVE
jgi:PKD repeat protein